MQKKLEYTESEFMDCVLLTLLCLLVWAKYPLIMKDRLGHEDIETTLGTYGHLYPNSNFEVAHKLEGIMSYQTATENEDTSPKNQFTARYLRKGLKTNNAITMQ